MQAWRWVFHLADLPLRAAAHGAAHGDSAADQQIDEHHQKFVSGFAVSVAELTFFARQSGEETSQPVQMYLAVTLLYAVTAMAINRIMAWVKSARAFRALWLRAA